MTIFDRQLNIFRNKLTAEQMTAFRTTDYQSLLAEISRIQAMQESSNTLMNLRRIQPFLEAMDQFGKVVDVFLNTSDVLAFIWGPIKFLLLVSESETG